MALSFAFALLASGVLALEVDVESYGAKADAAIHLTNATLSTDGFNAAIAAVSAAGGGTVHARANGTYKTGRIVMMSGVRLEIARSATVQGSHQAEHWTPRVYSAIQKPGGVSFNRATALRLAERAAEAPTPLNSSALSTSFATSFNQSDLLHSARTWSQSIATEVCSLVSGFHSAQRASSSA